ncbi:HEL268Wp [Eremothecium sinecaudum]|uniref:HEL268Wp n=1 Tax=Eremothecium sinecaudum TaxID=45286 RepID=A0A109UZ61_9SACH|nr:HEL268Wp [Eremothecium sinecaudum]AMD21013.1 HEL268Wp [Eremothecium sinecaudum]
MSPATNRRCKITMYENFKKRVGEGVDSKTVQNTMANGVTEELRAAMDVAASVKSFEARLQGLELALGATQGQADLSGKLIGLTRQLEQLCERGFEFNTQLAVYLEKFTGDWQPSEETSIAFMSCYDDIERLVRGLQELRMWHRDDFDRVLRECADFTGGQAWEMNVSALPELYARCNWLIVRSMHVTLRFLRLSRMENEFSCETEAKLLSLKRKLQN